jgi:predicted ester cyclase
MGVQMRHDVAQDRVIDFLRLVHLLECPDFRATVEDLIAAEGDTVVTRLVYRGTGTGGLVRGHAATGKAFEFCAIYIWRMSNGKLAELWQEADRVRLMQHLGILST